MTEFYCCEDFIESSFMGRDWIRGKFKKGYYRHALIDDEYSIIEEIDYCPWCGRKLSTL